MGKIDCGHYVAVPVEIGPKTLHVAAGESVEKVCILRPESVDMGFDHIVLEENSKADVVVIILPGVSEKVSIAVDAKGEWSTLNLTGIYLCGKDENLSFSTEIRHTAGNCNSLQIFNGLAGGSSKVSFYGRIVIAPDAQKIEAYQTNRNILLSTDAVVDTKPQLEIYADDVKCSHGATVGSLNEDEQFYMRSRGIPEQEAKVLQMISFLAPVLEHISDEGLREKVSEEIESAIRQIA